MFFFCQLLNFPCTAEIAGDSWHNGQDTVLVSCIAYGILTKDDVSEVIYMAADCNNDSVIDEADVDTSPEQDKAKVNILEMIINFIKSIF